MGRSTLKERRVLGAEDGVLGLAGGDAREPLLAHFERALADVLGAPGVRGPDGDEDGGLLPRGARDGVDGAEDRCDVDDAGLHGRVFDLRLLRGDGVVVRAWQGKAITARVAAAGLRPVDELEEVGRANGSFERLFAQDEFHDLGHGAHIELVRDVLGAPDGGGCRLDLALDERRVGDAVGEFVAVL